METEAKPLTEINGQFTFAKANKKETKVKTESQTKEI
jgi:hypothetical protein